MKKRAEFKRAARGKRASRPAFTLQAVSRTDDGAPRVGFTVTKKTGNAVERNRIKRRLRAACTHLDTENPFQGGTDYVIVARRGALTEPFGGLVDALGTAAEELTTTMKRRMNEGA